MESKIVGKLNAHDDDADIFISEPIEIPYFEGQKLIVYFVEARYQPYLEGADSVLENFLKLDSSNKIKDSGLVKKYYDMVLKHGYTEPLNILSIQDIWQFVNPSEIMIFDDEKDNLYVCVSCECEWEKEHGLQLVFKNGQTLTRASGHNGHFAD